MIVLGACSPADAKPKPPASSPGNGVTVDPGSPSGKEYAIPIDTARREAAGGSAPGPGSTGSGPTSGTPAAPLFGVGVGRSARSDQPSRAQPASRAPGNTARGHVGSSQSLQQHAPGSSAASVPDRSASSYLGIGAIGAGTLLLGAGLGLALRRLRRPAA